MLRTLLQWLVPISVLIGAAILWEKSPTELITPNLSLNSKEFPYAFMTDIETFEYNDEGKLRFALRTPAANYYQLDPSAPSDQDYTLIEQPNIVFYSLKDTAPWHLSAAQGRSDAKGEDVRLTTEVVAEQQSTTQGLIQVTTSELHINIQQQYAETDKAVKMRAQQGQIETVGMRAFLNEDRIELLAEVRGTYVP